MPSQLFATHSSLMFPILLCLISALVVGTGALIVPRQDNGTNDGIHLAVKPQCGPLSGNMSDVSAGLDLGKYRTIVSFGVSPHLPLHLSALLRFNSRRTLTPMVEVHIMVLLWHHPSSYPQTPKPVDDRRTGRSGSRISQMILVLGSWITL